MGAASGGLEGPGGLGTALSVADMAGVRRWPAYPAHSYSGVYPADGGTALSMFHEGQRQAQSPVLRGLVLALEAVYHALGPLCGHELWSDPLAPHSFLSRASGVSSVKDARDLLYSLATAVHPR